jgi:hypothetical protein
LWYAREWSCHGSPSFDNAVVSILEFDELPGAKIDSPIVVVVVEKGVPDFQTGTSDEALGVDELEVIAE